VRCVCLLPSPDVALFESNFAISRSSLFVEERGFARFLFRAFANLTHPSPVATLKMKLALAALLAGTAAAFSPAASSRASTALNVAKAKKATEEVR